MQFEKNRETDVNAKYGKKEDRGNTNEELM